MQELVISSANRQPISNSAIAQAVIQGLLPGVIVGKQWTELRKTPAGYQGNGCRRGLGRTFRVHYHQAAGSSLLEVTDLGFFFLEPVTAIQEEEQARQRAQALAAAPFVLSIGTRPFPVADVRQAVEWAAHLIGYLPRFTDGFVMEKLFLNRDYTEIITLMKRDGQCALTGVSGVAYLLPQPTPTPDYYRAPGTQYATAAPVDEAECNPSGKGRREEMGYVVAVPTNR